MRFVKRAGLAVGAIAAVVGLAGCGSNGTLLSQGAATQLTAELTQASTALNQYNCEGAYSALTNFRNDVAQLTGVNTTLVQMLSQGASTVTALAGERCPSGTSTGTTTTATSTSAATITHAVTTTTTPTTTVPTTSTPVDTATGGTGGAAPTTATTAPVVTTPPVTSATEPATTPDSGGAGLSSSSGNGGTGGSNQGDQ